MRSFIFEKDYNDTKEETSHEKELRRMVGTGEAEERACEMCEMFNGYYCTTLGNHMKGLLGCIVTTNNKGGY